MSPRPTMAAMQVLEQMNDNLRKRVEGLELALKAAGSPEDLERLRKHAAALEADLARCIATKDAALREVQDLRN